MIRKLSPAPLAVLAAAALLAGCGSSSSTSSSTASTGASTGSSSTPTTGAPKLSATSVEQCKHGVSALPTVSQATKHRLEAICDKAASGDAATARAAAREGCEEIVKAAPLPEGTAKQRALSACKSAETPEKK